MSSESVINDFLLSSTPLQSSEEDSGYFGSNQKRKFYALNTFSPVKELCLNISDSFISEQDFTNSSQLKYGQKVLEYEDFNNEEFSDSEHLSENVAIENIRSNLSELHYIDISYSKNAENEASAFSSKDKHNKFKKTPDDLTNKKFSDFKKLNSVSSLSHANIDYKLESYTLFKQNKIDFLHCLNEMNCLSILSSILSSLSAKELCIASCVNKEWNQIVQNDHNAHDRMKNFIKERNLFLNGPCKENRLGVKCSPARQLKKAFTDLTNHNTDKEPLIIKYSTSRFDSFLKESENGHLKLRKCPKCCYASKSLNEYNYKCTNCSLIFCSSCLNPVIKNHSCKKSVLPNIIIGSKKSKKNLKRL